MIWGHIIYDVSGEEKRTCMSPTCWPSSIASGGEFANDRMIFPTEHAQAPPSGGCLFCAPRTNRACRVSGRPCCIVR